MILYYSILHYCHTRLHLGFSAELRIWQVPGCKMEPRSGTISWKNRPPTHPPTWPYGFWFCVSLSPPIMSVPIYYVCPHLLCLSPAIMSVPIYYVCPHLVCLSPPIMSVPSYYVCPNQLCLSPPIMSVPTYLVCPLLLCLSPRIMSVPS